MDYFKQIFTILLGLILISGVFAASPQMLFSTELSGAHYTNYPSLDFYASDTDGDLNTLLVDVNYVIDNTTIFHDQNSSVAVATNDINQKVNLIGSPDGNYLITLTAIDNALNTTIQSYWVFIDTAAPVVTSVVTVDEDYLYGINRELTVKVNATDLSGIGRVFIDLNNIIKTNCAVSGSFCEMTQKTDGNWTINLGDGWDYDFNQFDVNVRVGDKTLANFADANYLLNDGQGIFLYSLEYVSSDLNGISSTNFKDINNFQRVLNLTFEKTGYGKIVFNQDINLLDGMTVNELLNLANAITIDVNSENTDQKSIDINSLAFANLNKSATLYLYNLNYSSIPKIIYINSSGTTEVCSTDRCSSLDYNLVSKTATFNVTGFSKYQTSYNLPVFTNSLSTNIDSAEYEFFSDSNTLQIQASQTFKLFIPVTKGSYDLNLSSCKIDINGIIYSADWNSDGNNCQYQFVSGVPNGSSWTVKFNIKDINGHDVNSATYSIVGDSSSPIITILSNSSVSTSTGVITLRSNEKSTCKYNSSNVSYDSMNSSVYSLAANTSLNVTISGLSSGTSYGYYFKCKDYAGNESNADNNYISFTTSSSSSPDSAASSASSSSNSSSTKDYIDETANTPNSTPLVISKSTDSDEISNDEVRGILTDAKDNNGKALFSEEEILKMVEESNKFSFVREVKVEEIDNNGIITYQTTFTIKIKNTTDKNLSDVLIVEVIPKDLINFIDLNMIKSIYQFRILASDPVVEFTVPLVDANTELVLEYTIDLNNKPDVNNIVFSSPLVKNTNIFVAKSTDSMNWIFDILQIIIILIVLGLIIGAGIVIYSNSNKSKSKTDSKKEVKKSTDSKASNSNSEHKGKFKLKK
ncbi:MAG: hypothetical protein PHQ98_00520 [Candidatus ainarchaeum sp.]|nr:hypothetical protein [Candidatus ainarchaeum sp.]